MYRHKVKIIISNKTESLEKRVNKALEELETNGYDILTSAIKTSISFSGEKGYQAMVIIPYLYWEEANELDCTGFNINFGLGESPIDNTTSTS